MPPRDHTTAEDTGEDLEAGRADPVLTAARAEAAQAPPGEPPPVWGALVPDGPLDDAAVEARARALLDALSRHERIALLAGDGPLVRGVLGMARHYNETPY